MYKFQGEYSDETKKYIKRYYVKANFIVALIVAAIALIPIIVLSVVNDIVFLLAAIALLMFPGLMCIPPKHYPFVKKIVFEDEYITAESEKFVINRKTEQIKKIIDFGTFYHIHFYFPHKEMNVVCQKDLLVQGSIEEFADMFKDKIVLKD